MMTHSSREKTTHSRNLACLYPVHCPINPKKDLFNPDKGKKKAHDLPPSCPQLSCCLSPPEPLICFEFSRFCMTPPSCSRIYVYLFNKIRVSSMLSLVVISYVRSLMAQTTLEETSVSCVTNKIISIVIGLDIEARQ